MNQNNIGNTSETTIYSKPSISIFEMEAEGFMLANSNVELEVDPKDEGGDWS